MTAPIDGDYGATVASGTKVRDVVQYVATTDLPIRVVSADGLTLGTVDRVSVLSVVAGADLSRVP